MHMPNGAMTPCIWFDQLHAKLVAHPSGLPPPFPSAISGGLPCQAGGLAGFLDQGPGLELQLG